VAERHRQRHATRDGAHEGLGGMNVGDHVTLVEPPLEPLRLVVTMVFAEEGWVICATPANTLTVLRHPADLTPGWPE
jgi:hypothetical protein